MKYHYLYKKKLQNILAMQYITSFLIFKVICYKLFIFFKISCRQVQNYGLSVLILNITLDATSTIFQLKLALNILVTIMELWNEQVIYQRLFITNSRDVVVTRNWLLKRSKSINILFIFAFRFKLLKQQ